METDALIEKVRQRWTVCDGRKRWKRLETQGYLYTPAEEEEDLQKPVLQALCWLPLQSFPSGGSRKRGGEEVTVSHLTCNKAERITCSLPLTVCLLPQGVPISFPAVHFSRV